VPSISTEASRERLRKAGATDFVSTLFSYGFSSQAIASRLRQQYPYSDAAARSMIFREGKRQWDAAVQWSNQHNFSNAWQTPWRARKQNNAYEYVVSVRGAEGGRAGQYRLIKVVSDRELRKWEMTRAAQEAIAAASGTTPGQPCWSPACGGPEPTRWEVIGVLYAYARE
jgi:hypothetical protein